MQGKKVKVLLLGFYKQPSTASEKTNMANKFLVYPAKSQKLYPLN